MTKSNTPLEITNHIKDNAAALFEVRRISKALSDITVLAAAVITIGDD